MNLADLMHPDFKLAVKLSTGTFGTVIRREVVKSMLVKAHKRVLDIREQSVVREAVHAYFNGRVGKERVHFSETANVQAVYAWLECVRHLSHMGTIQTSGGFLPSLYYSIPHPRYKGTYAISRSKTDIDDIAKLSATLSQMAGSTKLPTFMSDKDYRPTLQVLQTNAERAVSVIGGLTYTKVKGKPKNLTLPF